jgi:hypothetical protein
MMPSAADRRKGTRIPAKGTVALFVDEPHAEPIRGHLMDTSSSGFRATHNFAGLRSGQHVRFRLPGAEGKALVVWNRIMDGGVESGFFIMRQSPAAKAPAPGRILDPVAEIPIEVRSAPHVESRGR